MISCPVSLQSFACASEWNLLWSVLHNILCVYWQLLY